MTAAGPAPADLDVRATSIERCRRHVNAGMARIYELTGSPLEVASDGAYIHGGDGGRYLDLGGYCVFLLGHRHPQVVAAVARQLAEHPLSGRVLPEPRQFAAAEALARRTPPGLDRVWFASSGAEAVEAALKLVRLNGCQRFLSAEGAFHGKTLGALSVSGRDRYRALFEPLLPGTDRVPFGDADALAAALAADGRRAAVILEPVQSEAGVRLPPPDYLSHVRALCDAHGALLVADEISTGLGRTGRWFEVDRSGVQPDVLLVGKALGGGVMPVSALVARTEVFAPFDRDPLLHTSTFAGNPLAATAALATVQVVESAGLVERSERIGARLLAGLRSLCAGNPVVTEVRGRGLLIGLETTRPDAAAELLVALMDRKVLVAHSLNDHRVVRLTPPAVLTDDEVELALAAMADALQATASRLA